MAKIRKSSLVVTDGSIKRNYQFDIYYANNKFYTLIPQEFNVIFESMSDNEKNSKFCMAMNEKGYGKPPKKAVYGDSESKLISHFHDLLKYMMSCSIKKRSVIIVHFSSVNIDDVGNQINWYRELSPGIEFIYAIEYDLASNKTYAYEQSFGGNIDTGNFRDVHISKYNNKWRIIDDTPSNRKWLEDLYSVMVKLNDAMAKFSTEENLLEAINSKQKLLSQI